MSVASKLKALAASETPDAPKSLWDRIVANTPVVMTIVATILAGLSSSEMTAAQYHRSMAAQFQAKAGDQWNYFQAKRLREAGNQTGIELLNGMVSPVPLDTEALKGQGSQFNVLLTAIENIEHSPKTEKLTARVAEFNNSLSMLLNDPKTETALKYLAGDDLPSIVENQSTPPSVAEVLSAIDAGKSELDTVGLVRKVSRQDLDTAEAAAFANANNFDSACKPFSKALDQLARLTREKAAIVRSLRQELSASNDPASAVVKAVADAQQQQDALLASFTVARLNFDARRYHAEAAYNQAIARLYEVEIRRSGGMSDRNRDRSKDFFYGMLIAQAAVTIATFSLAMKQKSFLWSLASLAGLLAISLGVYVYAFT